MNKQEMSGKFDQLKGKAKELWGKMTDDELSLIDGKVDQFKGKVVERYGISKEEAEKQYAKLESDCGCGSMSKSTDRAA